MVKNVPLSVTNFRLISSESKYVPIGFDSVGVGPASKSLDDLVVIPMLLRLDIVYLILRGIDFSFVVCG